jgi:hypothetical protein
MFAHYDVQLHSFTNVREDSLVDLFARSLFLYVCFDPYETVLYPPIARFHTHKLPLG